MSSRESLSKKAYHYLLERLLANDLKPGDLLNRREVALQTGMSVAPVLEAMLSLEAEGYLETLPRKGTRVRMVTPEDIRGRLTVREAIECQVARMACGGPVSENTGRLLRLAKRVDALRSGSVEKWNAEIAFHRALAELTQCPLLVKEFDRHMRLNYFTDLASLRRLFYSPSNMSKHEALVTALKTKNPAKAEKAMRDHILRGKERIFQSQEKAR